MGNHHSNQLTMRCLGAAQTVTGSKTLLESGDQRILIDCGLFQGRKPLRLQNWKPFPVDPATIDAVILTHAHLDHSGYLPALVKHGFKGPIYCSEAGRDLVDILLRDAAHLQEEEAKYRNRHQLSKHKPALPLFTQTQAQEAIRRLHPVPTHQLIEHEQCRFTLHPNGHILGSTFIELEMAGRHLLFSGDLGRPNDPIMYPPEPPVYCDTMILESTYGNRLHGNEDAEAVLGDAVNRTLERGGSVLIPAFAIGRSQMMLVILEKLRRERKIPAVPIYLDSPMAVAATEAFQHHNALHRISAKECQRLKEQTHWVSSVEESIDLTHSKEQRIVISASGMATGGRVLFHLKSILRNPDNSVIFAGFQAPGTRGETLVNGEDRVKIHGEYYPVKAEVINLDSFSAHADYQEIIEWLRGIPVAPKRLFINHGEPDASLHLQQQIADELGWSSTIVEQGNDYTL